MSFFRKKPVVIEAMHWTDADARTTADIMAWLIAHDVKAWRDRVAINHDGGPVEYEHRLWIRTLEGDMFAKVGDYIIKGVQGEFYPCKPDIFAATYDAIEVGE